MNEVKIPRLVVWIVVGFIAVAIGWGILSGLKWGSSRRELREYRAAFEQSRERVSILEDELELAERDIEELRGELTESRTTVDSLLERVEVLKGELETARDYIEQFGETNQEATESSERLRELLKRIREEVQRIRKSLQEG
jgi:chromosome segregation ATPase